MLRDLFRVREALGGSSIALVDSDPRALQLMKQVADGLNDQLERPFLIEAHTDRPEALPGAQFVIISVAVRRNERWRLDFKIPLKYGVRHVLGENGGPGGLFHTMRNIPIILNICRDIEAICPEALVINFTNPEGRICLTATRYMRLRFVGLCHGIGMAQATIAQALDLPIDEIAPKAGGLNHLSWILQVQHRPDGGDLYSAFKRAMAERQLTEIQLGEYRFSVQLCHRLMDTFDHWPLPSDDHVGEYFAFAWEICGLGGYDFDQADKRVEANRKRVEHWSRDTASAMELLSQASDNARYLLSWECSTTLISTNSL